MKKLSAIALFLLLSLIIRAQENNSIIAGSYNNLSFEEFANQLEEEHGIAIFFKAEWVEGLRLSASGDSINLISLLNNILIPEGLYLYKKNDYQIFLTGKNRIDDSQFFRQITESTDTDSTTVSDNRVSGKISYEKSILRATIGQTANREAGGISHLTGRVTSSSSGEPVIGATLYVEGTSNGVISNSDGFYALNLDAGTNFRLNVSCLGMEQETYHIVMNSSGVLNIELAEKLIDIQEVVVRAGKNDNVRGIQMGFQRIAVREIKTIPVVMGERDILKVANMLPGVQTVGEGSAGFNVRGSSTDQNLFLINEIPVLNTGHLFGFFSAFNPDMVNDFNLYKSNFPVEYGGRLASVFEVTTRKGNKKKFGARGGVSPITGSLLIETPLVTDKASFIIGGRSTYSDWILNRMDDYDIRNSNAMFYDLMSGIHILPDENSSLQIFGYYSKDKFTLAQTNKYRYENKGGSIIYDRQIGEGWKVELAAIMSQYNNYQANIEQPTSSYDHEFKVAQEEFKMKLTGYKFNRHRITGGGNLIFHHIDQGQYLPLDDLSLFPGNDFGKEQGIEYGLFIADEFSIADNLTLYGGIRFSSFSYLGPNDVYAYDPNAAREITNITDTSYYKKGESITNYKGPEYRLSVNYNILPDLSLKMSYNRMRQYLFMLSNTVAISPTDKWKLVDSHTAPPVSDQISLGLYKNFNSRALETSAEVYYKKSNNIVEYKDGADLTANPLFETSILQGYQNSWGAEFLIKRNAGRFTGWTSYTYSRSLIRVNSPNEWDKINYGNSYPANFDKPHAFNFVGNLSLSRRFTIASNIVYNTGRPITYPVGIYTINGIESVTYSGRNEYRIPDYFRIDLAVSIEGNLIDRKFAHGSWMFAVYNLTGRKNAYSIYFKNEDGKIKGYKQSIYGVPVFTISYNFKLGNYAVE